MEVFACLMTRVARDRLLLRRDVRPSCSLSTTSEGTLSLRVDWRGLITSFGTLLLAMVLSRNSSN
jgi:hypothetical protein